MPEKELTQTVRKGEELHAENLKKFLLQNNLIDSEKSELVVRQFYNGYSNLTYLLKIEEKDYVLRRPPFAAPKRGHNMGREFKVLSKLHNVFEKTPVTYAYTEDVEILGAPFYIMNKVEGIILTAREAKGRNVSPNEFKKISNSWLDTFVELHNVDYKAAGLESLGNPEGYVERQVKNWGKQYLAAATEEVISAKKVMTWMENNQPGNYDYSLIHNDYKYDNVVFVDDQWKKIAAVLDWEMCTLGDPMMDLGTSLGYWTTTSDADFLKQGLPSPTIMPGNPTRTEIVNKYSLKSGRDINNLTFYFAYGLFKIAVIAQQIYYRFKHGYTKDPRFEGLNKVSALCCNTAWNAIQKDSIDELF
ncbi:MAG: phosphotransferase family protein [Flavobacteriaceae bacterium]|nr:MAG: phosphotransferase family protein [Flavobacteriaceae bacterium]